MDTKPDAEAAGQMIQVLAGSSPVTFQTYPEARHCLATKRRGKIYHGCLSDHLAELTRANMAGHAVTMMLNQGDGKGRASGNVVAVRALFVDLDGAPLELVERAAAPPHLILETSPGRYHAYWCATDVPNDQFRSLQMALAVRFAGDPAVSDLSRCVRLAGFWHQKGDPAITRIVRVADLPAYRLRDLEQTLGHEPARNESGRGSIAYGSRNDTLLREAPKLRQRGHRRDHVLAAVRTINQRDCVPPLKDAEVRSVVESAFRYGVRSSMLLGPAETTALFELDGACCRAYLLARRQLDGGAPERRISLTQVDLGMAKATRRRVVGDLVKAGLMTYSARRGDRMRGGQKAKCDLFCLPLVERKSVA